MALRRLPSAVVALLILVGGGVEAQAETRRPAPTAANVQRLEYAVALHSLDAALLASSSATRTLEAWCRDHRLALEGVVTAEAVAGEPKPITSEQRQRLAISSDEPVRYRRVRLKCGAVTLSNADNWYVPSRLTPAMNEALDHSDTPFGKVVGPLGISRRTVSATVLWDPLETRRRAGRRSNATRVTPATPPADILQHRADVLDRDGRPIAEVVETYTGAALSFLGR